MAQSHRTAELPRGTVTFLFTDVESSTQLLREHRDAYPQLLAEHRRALREAVARHGGVEVGTQGDGFFVAFARASDAVAAAEDAQRALAEGPMRVRMGLHTGEPVVTGDDYTGLDVHRAARIAAAGHGGQVLMSQSTRDLAGRNDILDLGQHRLKDLPVAERIYQLGGGQFPPLRSLYATNLPVPLTPFIGRKGEVADAKALLSRDDVRLLTLTGAGGSGKTRLALEVGASLVDDYEHGVWWVPLSAVSEPEDVMPAAGRVLGGGSPLEAVANRRLLLVLDNFEHVIAAAPEVATLLAACPHVDVLVTSRERLSLNGEHVYPVPVLARDESRELFLECARAGAPNFEAGQGLDELCARLDDLPLAIELAAARSTLLTVTQLLARLGTRLDLLHTGRDAEARHRTLRTTIGWSYELLIEEEQHLLAALSVFRGGWTLETSERVAGATLELLQSLVDKSLVRRLGSGRFTMLDTINEFAAEQLDPSERDRILYRLLRHQLELFSGANLSEDTPGPPQMALADAERPNIDVALAWAEASGHEQAGLRLLLLTEMYWITNDPVAGRERLDALLAGAGDTMELGLKARALRFRGASFDLTNRYDLSELEFSRSLEAFRIVKEEHQIAPITSRIANSALRQGDVDRAIRLATASLDVARRRKHPGDEGFALYILAMAAFQQKDLARGAQLAHESAALSRQAGFIWLSGVTLLATAEHLIAAGQVDQAERDFLVGLETIASVIDHVNIPYAFAAGAAIAAVRHDVMRAGTLWGALEGVAEREPKTTTQQAIGQYAPYVEGIQGVEFDRGRARGRNLSLDEAIEYALSNRS